MLVSLQNILKLAEDGGFCIPAFNVYNVETVMGVIAAAESEKAPVILQLYPRLVKEEVGYYLAPSILAAAKKASVPVCFHLDHGPSMLEVQRALRYGAVGVMLDGSAYPLRENIRRTREAVEACACVGVGVEGELGHIGTVNDEQMDAFTDPACAAEFVKQTGVCCLAVLIGNAHGRYKKPPKLDIERITAIRQATGGIPLVLHGGSGIPEEEVKAAIKAGIRKMNIATDVCHAFADALLAELQNPDRSVAIDVFVKPAIERVRTFAVEKIRLVGADGKAKV